MAESKGGEGRTIPINDTVYNMLVNKERLCESVLTGASGRQTYADYLIGRFKQYILKAGLNPKLHFHYLRHTFATLLVQDGTPIYELKELLGHKDVKTTQIYSHMEVDTLRGAVARLDRMKLVSDQ
ncbi:MAG: tyrosine-type recombinase/integrase [Sedimentisphaerales bacterium]|nr:tyrosine-type recombinase/integrase [Sedimentisphaerales bacterium]